VTPLRKAPYYGARKSHPFGLHATKVIGKRFVAIAAIKDPASRSLEADPGGTGGNVRVAPAAAADVRTFGVATYDAEVGKLTTVVRAGFVVPVTAGVALAYGDLVAPGANGKAVLAAAGKPYGISLSDAVVDQDAIVALI
jgi:hypothetical protein